MEKVQTDLFIFKDFNFTMTPVGVKFLSTKPKQLKKLDKQIALCEMLKEAQQTEAFYAARDNFHCKVGPLLLGMEEPDLAFEGGQIGPKLGVFEDARANKRIFQQVPRLERNSVNYVAFAPLEQINFDPDLLIITAPVAQAEIILRASSYSTGKMWNFKGTPVIGCAWMFVHPYVSGELNMMTSGLYHGMKARKLFPEGLSFIIVPYDLIQSLARNLSNMEWYLPQFEKGKEAHIKNMQRIVQEITSEMEDN